MSPTEIEIEMTEPSSPSATGSTKAADGARDVLFEGDEGLLPAEVRNTLARLLSTRFVDGVRNPAWWARVQRHEDILRSRLNDVYLELVLDRRHEVAFTQQVELGEDVPVLLRKDKPLSLPAAILLLHLRQEYDRGAVEGRDVVVDHADLLDHLEVWKNVDDQNPATFRKRCEAAITTVREKGILVLLTAERYRISGVIHALLTAEKVDAMTAAFEEMAENGAEPAARAADPREDD
ncbi:DUF4194 domain-containing protein [Pengzhenrongella frigida]|uniref:DUF4194 domain-containing protein n=1 Tax=Pengzhenrongella frigida TaxID=1259133 RepID=A0A4Q5N1W7_9MICO|nr:DUF4194 domain-containing protein [Cellulomonas sp. HLT2-17]RYV52099.1 DUF4194 domain-containing protein [Cellulomonas sp. HLT2-17]